MANSGSFVFVRLYDMAHRSQYCSAVAFAYWYCDARIIICVFSLRLGCFQFPNLVAAGLI